jgi:uncharacterized protein YukE
VSTPAGGFEVKPDALTAHENELRQIADQVQASISASGSAQAALDLNAFGLVGQIFAIPIQGWITTASGFLNLTAAAGQEVADRLKNAKESLDDNEDKTVALLNSVGKGVLE